MNILIIGCGSIGSTIAKSIDDVKGINKCFLFDRKPETAILLENESPKCKFLENPEEHANLFDIVVEAASVESARTILPEYLSRGKDVVVMSVGSLVDDAFRQKCLEMAKSNDSRVIVPSGAIGGIDAISAAKMNNITSVRLITRKNPKGFIGSSYLEKKGIDPAFIQKKTLIFEGTPRDAVEAFPRNINVAATLSLAGMGFDETKVTIIADPTVEKNIHRVEAKGEFGEMTFESDNRPSEMNPKTSMLAALSALGSLERLSSHLVIGL